VIERNLVFVGIHIAVHEAAHQLGIEFRHIEQVVPHVAEVDGTRLLAEGIAEIGATPQPAVGALAFQSDQPSGLVLRVAAEVVRIGGKRDFPCGIGQDWVRFFSADGLRVQQAEEANCKARCASGR